MDLSGIMTSRGPGRGIVAGPGLKACIVAESFQPGARLVDVARRYDLATHHLSDWRKRRVKVPVGVE